MTTAILFIGGVLFLGQVFSSLFEKTRLPDVLPLMLLGLLIGPVSGGVHPADFGRAGEVFTTLALIVVLFQGKHNGINTHDIGFHKQDRLGLGGHVQFI